MSLNNFILRRINLKKHENDDRKTCWSSWPEAQMPQPWDNNTYIIYRDKSYIDMSYDI
jgi:hypothetical protein